MGSRVLRVSVIAVLSLIMLGTYIGIAQCHAPDGLNSLIWTTDPNGTAEVNLFSLGDPIYLRSTDKIGVLWDGRVNYTIYLFEGNVFNYVNGQPLTGPDSPPLAVGFTPINITTDEYGRFGLPEQGGPIKIWNHATFGNFTVVLEYLGRYRISDNVFEQASGIGTLDYNDFRDDICSSADHFPSFSVLPEPAVIASVATMFGAFGSFLLIKKKRKA